MSGYNKLKIHDGIGSMRDLMCPWCKLHIYSEVIITFNDETGSLPFFEIFRCTNCYKPIIFEIHRGSTIPHGCEFEDIRGLPEGKIKEMYKEIRDSYSIGAYTCSVTCCRTLLAHIAVEAGAESDENFQHHVRYIEEKCLAPFMEKDWLDRIRKSGNVCVHDFVIADKNLACDMIRLSEIVLNSMYNIPDSKNDEMN